MATKKKKSKTEAIREALKESANGSPSEVAQILNDRGIKVSAAYVSTIKSSDKRRAMAGRHGRPGRPAGSQAMAGSSARTEELKEASELMLKAVDLVVSLGADQARQLISTAEKMVNKIGA